MKAWIQRHRDYTLGELMGGDARGMLAQAVGKAMTCENVSGWFRDCGYM
jgi:hypothetical protein